MVSPGDWSEDPVLGAAIGRVAQQGTQQTGLEEAVQQSAQILGEALQSVCVIGLRTGEAAGSVIPLGLHHPTTDVAAALDQSIGVSFRTTDFLGGAALDRGETVFRHDLDPAHLAEAGAHFAPIAQRWGLTSLIIVPLSARTGRLGAAMFARLGDDAPFSHAEFEFTQTAAAVVALLAEDAFLVESLRAVSPASQVTVEWHPGGRQLPPSPELAKAAGALSAREREILGLLAHGFTNREIASRLYLSVRTVEWHRSRLQWKLGISSRAELMATARALGFADGPGAGARP